MAEFPRSGSLISDARTGTHTGLSTSILVTVDTPDGQEAVGAIQEMTVTTRRPIQRVREVGFDGFLEAVPNQPTEVQLTVRRVYFDRLRLPEAFTRDFKYIHQQRVPFNINVFDFIRASRDANADPQVVDSSTFHNCWFSEYTYPYSANDYIITETATIICEYVTANQPPDGGARGITRVGDDQGVEAAARDRRGSLDVAGIIAASVGGVTSPIGT